MLLNITVACIVIVGTTIIHAAGMMMTFQLLTLYRQQEISNKMLGKALGISIVVLLMFMISVLEVVLWAAVYFKLGTIEPFERATYFSMVTYTTLGYGDIVLDQNWHLLSSFEAANGIIMFGWTTSIVIAVVQRVYFVRET